MQQREAEEAAKVDALRHALDEAETAVAAGDLSDYTDKLLDETDVQERERPGARGASV